MASRGMRHVAHWHEKMELQSMMKAPEQHKGDLARSVLKKEHDGALSGAQSYRLQPAGEVHAVLLLRSFAECEAKFFSLADL